MPPFAQGRGPPRNFFLGSDLVVGLDRGGDEQAQNKERKHGADAHAKLHTASRMAEPFLVFERVGTTSGRSSASSTSSDMVVGPDVPLISLTLRAPALHHASCDHTGQGGVEV